MLLVSVLGVFRARYLWVIQSTVTMLLVSILGVFRARYLWVKPRTVTVLPVSVLGMFWARYQKVKLRHAVSSEEMKGPLHKHTLLMPPALLTLCTAKELQGLNTGTLFQHPFKMKMWD